MKRTEESFPLLKSAIETVAMADQSGGDAKAMAELVRQCMNTIASQKLADDSEQRAMRVYRAVMQAPREKRETVLVCLRSIFNQ